MELSRLKRILRDRWVVVLVIALLGAIGAWAFTGLANQSRESRYQAELVLNFQPQEGQTIDDLGESVASSQGVALIAAQDLIAEDPTSGVVADVEGARLIFTALGDSRDEASAKSEALLAAFLGVDPLLAGVNVNQRLDQVRQQADNVELRIRELNDEITPPITDAEQAQIDNLELQIQAFSSALVEIIVAETTALDADRPAITRQKENVEAILTALQEQRAALPETEPGTPTAQQQLELLANQAQLTELQTEYQRLYLRQLGYTENAQREGPDVTDLTAVPGSGLLNAGIGFLGGLAVALFGLIFINNSRKTIWLPEDLSVPLLADVPGRRTVGGVGQSWYENTGPSPRKTAIQALRSGVEARLAGTSGAVAVAGNRIGPAVVNALVTDLAASMASAGATVLLVDADLESDTALVEYQIGGPSLSAILKLSPDSLLLDREVGSIVDRAYMIRANLAVLPSGPPPTTPADALAGRQFRSFVQEASKRFDYVVVAVGEARSTAAQVAMQRIGRSVVVMTPGRSTEPQVTALVSEIAARQVTTLGAIFVQRSEGPVQGRESEAEPSPVRYSDQQAAPATSPLTRLSNYPFPERQSGVVPSSSLRDLADRVGTPSQGDEADLVRVDQGDDELGSDLLHALGDASAAEAYEAVADYLVTRVEDMMVAVPGQGDFSEGLTGELHDNGFLPLRTLPDHRSVGTWLAEELHREAPGATSDGIVAEMERILGFATGADSMSFDDWLAEEFFSRHLRRTNGDPYVWHLSSEEGTTQVLAHATRFDRTSVEIVISDVVRRMVDRLERDLKAANARGYADRSKAIEGHLTDVRRFEGALGWLIGAEEVGTGDGRRGTNGRAASWNPDWALGLRENLAPIQRAGLLPFPVLSDEEMDTFLAVV